MAEDMRGHALADSLAKAELSSENAVYDDKPSDREPPPKRAVSSNPGPLVDGGLCDDDIDHTPALFLEEITEGTEKSNSAYLGLQTLADEVPPAERAENFKTRGNRALTLSTREKGNHVSRKKFLKEAAMLYTEGLEIKCEDGSLNSQLLSNRAHINVLLGNYRRAIADCAAALERCATNVKACFRGAKAALKIPDFGEAVKYCAAGLALEPDNEELVKMNQSATAAQAAEQSVENAKAARLEGALSAADALAARGIVMGTAQFDAKNRTCGAAEDGTIVWPVTLLYPQSMSQDLIEQFEETSAFGAHLDGMFGDSAPPLPWDTEGEYSRDRVELYWARRSNAKGLPRETVAKALLHNGRHGEDDRLDQGEIDGHLEEWVRVDETQTLASVLAMEGHVMPGIHPCFFVVARGGEAKRKLMHGLGPDRVSGDGAQIN